MAQTGYTPISLYYSSTALASPSGSNLAYGELAINIVDGKLFYKEYSTGTVKVIAGTGGTGVVAGSNTQIQFNNNGIFGASSGLTWDGTSLTASNYVSAGNITINTNKFTVTGSSGNTVIAGSATINTLTSGRVTYAGTSGLLQDSANLTFDGTYLTANSIKDSALTSGRVTFAGASGLLSDSANLTWNGTSLGVTGTVAITGALTATADSTFSSTGALLISKGNTSQQPGTPVTGMMRYNTQTNQFEGYSGSSPAWKSIGGSALSNDTSTASNLYPVFAAATSGTAENLYTSNAQYLYKPSTGELSVKAPVAANGIFVNSTTVSSNYTIDTGYNGQSIGPITIASGVTVTVASGQRWFIQ